MYIGEREVCFSKEQGDQHWFHDGVFCYYHAGKLTQLNFNAAFSICYCSSLLSHWKKGRHLKLRIPSLSHLPFSIIVSIMLFMTYS